MSKGSLSSCERILTSLKIVFLGVGLSLFSSVSVAAPVATPADWLMRMVTAPSSTSYQGLFIYENAAGLTSMRIFHAPEEGKLRERLVYQDGPYREIVRNGDQVAFVRPDGDVSRYRSEGVNGLVDRLANYQDDLRRSYRLLFGGSDRVAGRDTLRIEVQPRDNHRYGYALWLDRDSGLLLRSEMIGEKGIILERFQYIDMNPVEDLPVKYLEPSQPVVWTSKEDGAGTNPDTSVLKKLGWEAGWLPSGFALSGFNQIDSPVSRQKVDSLLFSDGLAAFSVFVEQDHSKVIGPASEQIGATSAVSRVFRSGEHYYNVTVVGEVPLGAAERVAVSVKPREALDSVDEVSATQP